MRLRWPRSFARHVACRCRTFLDRPNRLSRHATEHIGIAFLGELNERFDRLAIDGHLYEGRSGREVIVPDIMVRDLVMPDALAGFEIDADDRVAEQIAAQAMTAVIIV